MSVNWWKQQHGIKRCEVPMKGVKVICSVEGTRVGAVGSYTYLNFFPYGVQRVLVSRTSDIAHNHTWTPVGQESHCQPDVSKLQQHKIEHECKQISFEVRMRQADLSRLGNSSLHHMHRRDGGYGGKDMAPKMTSKCGD